MKIRRGLGFALLIVLAVSLTACNSLKFGKKEPKENNRRAEIARMLNPSATPTPAAKPKKTIRSLSWGFGLFGKDKEKEQPAAVEPGVTVRPSVVPTVRPLTRPSGTVGVSTRIPAAASPSAPAVAYRLKIGDPVIVMLEGPGGLNERYEDVVDERGNISLLYIGDVSAVRKTATALERDIKQLYIEKQIYRSLMARVLVPNTFYFIGGEVRGPGRFPLVGKVMLSQAIIAAGNFTEWADRKDIVIVRENRKITLNFREITADPMKDIELKAGDSITVGRRFM